MASQNHARRKPLFALTKKLKIHKQTKEELGVAIITNIPGCKISKLQFDLKLKTVYTDRLKINFQATTKSNQWIKSESDSTHVLHIHTLISLCLFSGQWFYPVEVSSNLTMV